MIPKARGLAARLEEEASAHRQRVVSQAEGDVSRFKQVLTEYSKAPQVTRDRMYLDTMQLVLSNSTKVIVDQKGGANLLSLPMDKLIQMTAPQQTQAAAVAQAPVADAAARAGDAVQESSRNRDIGRAREREGR